MLTLNDMLDEREQFGERLASELSVCGDTHRQAAEKVGCTGATIGRWIRGEVPFSVSLLAGLHRKYGIDLNELVCGKQETKK